MPRITILLPVYNAMPHLRHAVESIQRQTLEDFKVLAFDDGSTDGSGAYLDTLKDSRFTVVHQENSGLAATLNRMIPLVETEYIARLDADDICMPQRLERQCAFLDDHPEVAAVGTRAGYVMGRTRAASFGIGSRRISLSYAPPTAHPPYWDPLTDGQILSHSSVMMRTGVLKEVGCYPDMVPGQDLALWHRMALAGHKLANLDEMLILFRVNRGGISGSNLARQYHAWSYTEYRSKCIQTGQAPLPLADYVESHPLSDLQIRELRSKALLRNALADVLAGRLLRGGAVLLLACFRNPSLVLAKIRGRTGQHSRPQCP